MKTIFFDTEFDNFADLGLISFGFVSEDGMDEFYIENTDYNPMNCSDFVNKTVLPLLNFETFGSKEKDIKIKFENWINSFPEKHILFLTDYSGDQRIFWKFFSHLNSDKLIRTKLMFERMTELSTAKNLSSSQHNLLIEQLQHNINVELERIPSLRHHSLYDAKSNMRAWNISLDILNLMEGH